MPPGLGLLVGVLDHHHRGIDHCADGDGDAAQRHDVRVDALIAHDRKGDQHADRQRDDGHQRRAQVPEEQPADQRDDDELLQQLEAEVLHGAVDQLAAVVGGDDFDARRQAPLQLVQPGVHGGQRFPRVLAAAQDHHAADGLALPVQLSDASAHLRAELHVRNIAQGRRHAGSAELQRDAAKILERLQIARGTHHVLGLGQFKHGAASLLIGHLDRLDHLRLGHPRLAIFSGSSTTWYCLTMPPMLATSATLGRVISSYLRNQSCRLRSCARSCAPLRSISAYW